MRIPELHLTIDPSLGMIVTRHSFPSSSVFHHTLSRTFVVSCKSPSSIIVIIADLSILLSINHIAAPYTMYIAYHTTHTLISLPDPPPRSSSSFALEVLGHSFVSFLTPEPHTIVIY
jgi:hypothetical protein